MRQKMKYLGAVVLVLGGAGCGLPEAGGAASAGQAVEAGGKPRLAHEPSQALLNELKGTHADAVDPLDAAARAYPGAHVAFSSRSGRALSSGRYTPGHRRVRRVARPVLLRCTPLNEARRNQ